MSVWTIELSGSVCSDAASRGGSSCASRLIMGVGNRGNARCVVCLNGYNANAMFKPPQLSLECSFSPILRPYVKVAATRSLRYCIHDGAVATTISMNRIRNHPTPRSSDPPVQQCECAPPISGRSPVVDHRKSASTQSSLQAPQKPSIEIGGKTLPLSNQP